MQNRPLRLARPVLKKTAQTVCLLDMTERPANPDALLGVRGLRTVFVTGSGVVPAVDGLSLRVPAGKTVALVGESGCGKSVTALSVMRLIPQPPGQITHGKVLLANASGEGSIDLLRLTEKQMREIRGNRIAMIFQDPITSLNPVYTVGQQIVEAIELHQPLRGKKAWEATVEMLGKVGIPAPAQRAKEYPHRLSGGMLQRCMIAMALSCRPSLLIADEPTTALDVTIQMQILELLRGLQAEMGMSILLITHDFGVVAQIAEYVYVMYAGRIVEHGSVSDLLTNPLHPYTQGLLRCVPRLSQPRSRLEVIPGAVPHPSNYPRGCRFHPRCQLSADRARNTDQPTIAVASDVGDRMLRRCAEPDASESTRGPELREIQPNHFVACWEAGGPIARTNTVSQTNR